MAGDAPVIILSKKFIMCNREKEKYNSQTGFTMIETIIAIFIVLIGVVGAYGIMTNLTSYGTISPSRLTAVYLAKEGIEVIRNIRDTNWLEGHSWNEGLASSAVCAPSDENSCIIAWDSADLQATDGTVPFLKIDTGTGRYNYASGTTTIFKRKIIITAPVADYLLVTVKIEWNDQGKPYSLTTRERLYNWYQI